MKRSILLLFFLTTTLLSKEVLLLHSYHKGYKWSDDISKAIEKTFKAHKDIELTTIYMDTKRVAAPPYLDKLASLYKEQFARRDFDLVIVSDNNAFDFAIRYHDYLFKDLPILFSGINNFDKALLSENNMSKYMTGVVEQVDIEKNFELISKLHPNLENLIIINDTSKTGYAIKRDLRPIIEKYQKKFKINYIDNMDLKQIQNKVSRLDENSVILFVLMFKDTTGKYFTYKQSLEQIRSVSPVPIYGLWDFYLEYGIVGGLLTSAQAQGESVSKMAIELLYQNKTVDQIPILEKSPNRYIFDHNEITRFNIEVEDFLDDFTLINEPSTVYKEHTKFFVLSVVTILILTIIVITMKANIQRRKRVETELHNQLQFEKVLLNTLPNPIYYKNREGRFVGCNEAFAHLFNMSKDEVIGKTAFDFFPLDIARSNIAIDEKILKHGGVNTSEIAIHFNHEMRYFILNKAIYENADGNIGGIVCIMDDITERVQQKQFLIQQSKLAEMGDMVAAIAHQWNEPLVELSAQVQDIQTAYLLEELQTVDVENFVHDSMIQIQYMSKTLSDFRNFLKPSTKKDFFSIRKSFEGIFEITGKQIFYSNIDLKLNYQAEHDFLIFGYENEFKQVLLNLINNAKSKIIDKDKQDGRIKIDVYQDQHFNIIEIADNGGQIDRNIMGSIFDPYFTTKKDGTGIGLYMAKVIIEDKMQGFINVQNRDEEVVFTIKIPHKKESDENSTIRG